MKELILFLLFILTSVLINEFLNIDIVFSFLIGLILIGGLAWYSGLKKPPAN